MSLRRTLLLLFMAINFGCTTSEKKELGPDPDELLLQGEMPPPSDESYQSSKRAQRRGSKYWKQLETIKESGNTVVVTKAAAEILSESPTNLSALNALAIHYYKTGRIGMAKTVLERAFKSHPESSALFNSLGLIHLKEEETKAAIAAFKRALSLDSRNRYAAKNLGILYAQNRDYEKALPFLRRSFQDFQSSVAVANNYAVTLRSVGKPKAADLVFIMWRTRTNDPKFLYNYAVMLTDDFSLPWRSLEVLDKIPLNGLDDEFVRKVRVLRRRSEVLMKSLLGG